MDAESYEDQKAAEFIHDNFLPVKAHIKEHPAWFHRFDVVWTPTVLLLDSDGRERVRLEGYLLNNDFNAALKIGLGRIAFVQKKYADAERWYGDVVANFGNSHLEPEAMYWRAVSQLQGDQRSHGAGRSRRGASEDLPVQHVGKQGDSVVAYSGGEMLESKDVVSLTSSAFQGLAGTRALAHSFMAASVKSSCVERWLRSTSALNCVTKCRSQLLF